MLVLRQNLRADQVFALMQRICNAFVYICCNFLLPRLYCYAPKMHFFMP